MKQAHSLVFGVEISLSSLWDADKAFPAQDKEFMLGWGRGWSFAWLAITNEHISQL
jgi:hypothetical protein